MVKAVPFLLLAVSLVLSGSALVDLRNRILIENSRRISAKTPLRATALELEAEQSSAARAASSLIAPAEALAHQAAVFRRQALRESSIEGKIPLLCKSLSAMGQAIKQEPYNTRFLLYWADLRQMLASASCNEEYSSGSFVEVARYALERDPTNPQVLYAAALLLGWSGNSKLQGTVEGNPAEQSSVEQTVQSYELLNRFLSVGQLISPQQESYILSRLDSRQALSRAIPARFPQVATWAALLFRKDPVSYSHFAPTLAKLEGEAIAQSARDLFSGEISLDLHFRRMMSLFGLLQTRQVERQWTEQIIAIAERKIGAGATEFIPVRDHFRSRIDAVSLPTVLGFRTADTKPERSPLLNWDSTSNVDFGSFYGSLGFFLPSRRSVSAIELYAPRNHGQGIFSAHSIRVYVSEDNRSWVTLPQEPNIVTFNMLSNSVIAIRLGKPEEHRYWKIHYGSNDRSVTFSNELSTMLRVYGSDYSTVGG